MIEDAVAGKQNDCHCHDGVRFCGRGLWVERINEMTNAIRCRHIPYLRPRMLPLQLSSRTPDLPFDLHSANSSRPVLDSELAHLLRTEPSLEPNKRFQSMERLVGHL